MTFSRDFYWRLNLEIYLAHDFGLLLCYFSHKRNNSGKLTHRDNKYIVFMLSWVHFKSETTHLSIILK